jgi:hypothetical protein
MMARHTADMVSATRAALDCADIATAAQRVLSRPAATDAGVIRAILEARAKFDQEKIWDARKNYRKPPPP